MRRMVHALLPLLALVGCATAPPREPAVAPATPVLAAAAPGDAPFFPVPAIAATPPYAFPPPREIELSNGARALLVERRHAPVVAVSVLIRWASLARDAATEQMLREVLLDSPDASGRRLSERLGHPVEAHASHDGTTITFSIVSSELERSLGAVVDALRRGELPAERLDHHRQRALDAWSKQKPRDWTNMNAEMEAWLFPALHRESGRAQDFEASLKRLTVRDLDAYRKTAIRPGAISFCVAGDVGPEALRETLERVTVGWTAPAQTRRAPRAAGKLPAGALLVPVPGETDVRVLILVEAQGFRSVDTAAYVAQNTLSTIVAGRLGPRLAKLTPYSAGVGFDRRAEHRFLSAMIGVRGGNVAAAVNELMDTLGEVAHRELSEQVIGHHRANGMEADYKWWLDGVQRTAEALASQDAERLPFDWEAKRYEAGYALRGDDVRRAAQALLEGQVRVVAVGDVTGAKDELERMKLGPVTVKTASAPPASGGSGKK